MARVKRAKNSRKNHKKVLKLAKGYYGGKSKLFKTANESVIRREIIEAYGLLESTLLLEWTICLIQNSWTESS